MGLSARLRAIQAAAGAQPTEQTALDLSSLSPDGATGAVGAGEVVWPRSEILEALEQGAPSKALPLCLQAIAALSGDGAFAAEAMPMLKPVDPGEAWKRAYKTYSRYAPRVVAAGRCGDVTAALELTDCAVQEAGEIFSAICPRDPMAEQLAVAVCEALSRLYEEARSGN